MAHPFFLFAQNAKKMCPHNHCAPLTRQLRLPFLRRPMATSAQALAYAGAKNAFQNTDIYHRCFSIPVLFPFKPSQGIILDLTLTIPSLLSMIAANATFETREKIISATTSLKCLKNQVQAWLHYLPTDVILDDLRVTELP